MYKFIVTALLFSVFIATSEAQVAVGKTTIDGDGLLDFPANTTNGIILPIVTTLPTGTGATNGTLLMDYNDKKIKMRSNNQWIDLTKTQGDVSNVLINPSTDNGAGVIMGASTSSAEGVLVLESSSKALILPKINQPHLNVVSPYPGMICYDTVNKCISVFNGTDWYFWK